MVWLWLVVVVLDPFCVKGHTKPLQLRLRLRLRFNQILSQTKMLRECGVKYKVALLYHANEAKSHLISVAITTLHNSLTHSPMTIYILHLQ